MILAAVGIGGGGWFLDHYSLDDLKSFKLRPRRASDELSSVEPGERRERRANPIRIGAMQIRSFHRDTLENPHALGLLSQAARRFDLLVITDIDPHGVDAVESLVDAISDESRPFDSLVGPATGRQGERRAAFVFDQKRLEVDRSASYLVADPDRLFEHPPLVGWFRARGASAAEAFTFSLMAVDCRASELDAIGAAYRAVRDDGRGEDDVIMAGVFGAGVGELGPMLASTRLSPAIDGTPTSVRGDRQGANLLYSHSANEFTGRAGVMDLVRQFNLTVDQVLAITDEMPVWAEFAVLERDSEGLAAFRAGRTGADAALETAQRPSATPADAAKANAGGAPDERRLRR